MKLITAKELKEKIDNKKNKNDFTLVYVLPEYIFNDRHIPTSINIPLDVLRDEAAEKLPDKKQEIIVYCSGSECRASGKALKILEELGYTNLYGFEEGIEGWEKAGYAFDGRKW